MIIHENRDDQPQNIPIFVFFLYFKKILYYEEEAYILQRM